MPIEDLKTRIDRELNNADVPMATQVANNVPIYDCAALTSALTDDAQRAALKAELGTNLLTGSGTFVMRGAYVDTAVIDQASELFKDIIRQEKETKQSGADHFATAGANDRIWNSLEKLCRANPEVFANYHANQWVELASEAWLGPAFQMTAQVNLVRPSGKAQEAHCDYHLGFLTAEQVRAYPPHVHAFSPQLTLQGAIAHCDMPIESGTTKLLPFSQTWPENYLRYRDADVRALFEERHVQLPLKKGDLLFFSPGLLHGAGDNVTEDVERMANLIQISSAFGQAMESVNRVDMCKLVYPVLASGNLSPAQIQAAIASTGEGYPFPTSLDTDPPVGGLAPQSQQQLMHQGLDEGWSSERFNSELDARQAKRDF
ncbi:MAG: phytanoyl-CoA dioxygenase family protein [Rhizobiaceae bacterium]